MRLTAKITDATGASAHAKRTLSLVPAPLPVFIAGPYRGRRPVNIDLSGDGGNIVIDLHWSHWGYRGASASGTSNIQNCIPDCASGTDTPVSTSITLLDPSSKPGFRSS
jgi:hypothetical protein